METKTLLLDIIDMAVDNDCGYMVHNDTLYVEINGHMYRIESIEELEELLCEHY